MPNEPTGGGNPNVFTTFKARLLMEAGSGAALANPVVMLSIVNDVQFCGNAELTAYASGSAFATLPEGCRPETLLKLPVIVSDNAGAPGEKIDILKIGTDGELFLPSAYESATVHLEGVSFHVSGNIYKEV